MRIHVNDNPLSKCQNMLSTVWNYKIYKAICKQYINNSEQLMNILKQVRRKTGPCAAKNVYKLPKASI